MAKQVETDTDAKQQLWKRLEGSRISMLGVTGAAQHSQPMTHFADREAGVLWYITSGETDLAAAVGGGADASVIFMAPEEDYQAAVTGRLETVTDADKLDALWNVAVAAWFAGGRDDPQVRLLRFTPDEASIWASQANRVLVGLKLLRAGTRDGAPEPDVGVHRVVSFGRAA
ncbi:General stress protein 26 [Lutimaribacter pacificus]|uniref:General stress protein 26 n=1 Tax=Lutimaribacter pacificus TaxID=391948 RepID=A0A1H0M5A5_9RHOB|nr:pyridoxamine 5'-phosphate oxidase family protein [Lutimaribacter pacificus]SDO75629.1 General stress protein 26 [Lutimaribacter pacificus]SHK77964.1 General stress protein 26 [Lutimaribacter pacificus]